MLYFFTDLYKDEIFFSAINRYNRYSGNFGNKKSGINLFGRELPNQMKLFPCYLQYFSNQLGKETTYTPEYLIKNHTILPLYFPFLMKERIGVIIEDMKSNNSKGVYLKIGEFAGGICKNIGIRVCQKCIKEDEVKDGEAFIHREHQVPGNLVCYKHFEILREIIIPKYTGIEKYNIYNFHSQNSYVNESNFIYFKKLCIDIHEIFMCKENDIKFNELIKKYKVRLIQKGLASVTGIVNWKKVNMELLEFFPSNFLEILESNIMKDDKFTWTKMLLKTKTVVHPIRHILFIEFLFGSVHNLINFNEIEYSPFGKGPWPCLNPVAHHYKKDVVNDLEISRRSTGDKPLGVFKCNCGYSYTRLGPDKKIEDRYIKRTVKTYGEIWMKSLKDNIINQKYSISYLGKLMECDSKTIGTYAKELGVFHLLNSNMKTYKKNEENEPRYNVNLEEQYKSDILKLIEKNPNIIRSEVSRKLSKQYTWMFRYRKEWLYSKLPEKIDKHIDSRKVKVYVDWEIRDIELSEKVTDIINYMKMHNRNITISGISKVIKFPIKKYLHKLPNTKKVLEYNKII
ncbi:TnsD family transposase [Clostridium sp. ZS1]|uniref:TnsD family transposase n=1 Tax=Clostridium sp. ZS1 TaxID=2949989 RepID=UPI00207AC4A3|nr:TnsD family transposase [Clostridium sp. ZS1]